MPTIRILPKDLAEKIAAGEVVERPISAAKELIENSIDAGSTKILIEAFDGGKKFLAITDNGSGINEDQLHVALERHATSKIQNLDDLWKLRSMGFRGEALPSIAAVSRFTIESKSSQGRLLYLEGGVVKKDTTEMSGKLFSKTGTRVVVEDLFFNVPARLKFLKSKTSENSAFRDLVERLALCHPKIHFELQLEGRKSLDLKPVKSIEERLANILEIGSLDLDSFESQFENIQIKGFWDRNNRARNSNSIYLSVNQRMVRDKLLNQAVIVALRPRMMEGEFPRLFLSITLPPEDIDVNVHPAKTEVRFHRAKDMFQVVHGALDRLAKKTNISFYSTEQKLPSTHSSTEDLNTTPSVSFGSSREESQPMPFFTNDRVQYKTKSISENHSTRSFFSPPPTSTAVSKVETQNPSAFRKMHFIGQVKNTYLLFQGDDGIVIVDQHAAHERINYEKIKSHFLSEGLKSQPLLVSAILKCKSEDIDVALENEPTFSKLGFVFEAFGDAALIIRESPQDMDSDEALPFFKAVLETLKTEEELVQNKSTDPLRLSPVIERVIATAACHSSIRAGQALSSREAEDLVDKMENTESGLNCPHGRPASIGLSFSQIEGLFKR